MCNDTTVSKLKNDFHYTLSKFSHGAAAGTGCAGRVHDGTGVALVCDHQQQFIAGILG